MELGFTWGKRFPTQHIGDPLMLAWKEKVFFPILGNASTASSLWRNKHQATITYDHQPWQDFLRVLDDHDQSNGVVYLCAWTLREKTGGWFTLTLRPTVEAV